MTATRRRVLAAPVLVLAFALAGCTSATPTPSATSTSSSASSSRTATPAPAPSYRPDGTAQANKAWFDSVNTKLFAANSGANGRAIIDSLVSAGFDKAAMQVTPDRTSINGGVDSILFSVKIGDARSTGSRRVRRRHSVGAEVSRSRCAPSVRGSGDPDDTP